MQKWLATMCVQFNYGYRWLFWLSVIWLPHFIISTNSLSGIRKLWLVIIAHLPSFLGNWFSKSFILNFCCCFPMGFFTRAMAELKQGNKNINFFIMFFSVKISWTRSHHIGLQKQPSLLSGITSVTKMKETFLYKIIVFHWPLFIHWRPMSHQKPLGDFSHPSPRRTIRNVENINFCCLKGVY